MARLARAHVAAIVISVAVITAAILFFNYYNRPEQIARRQSRAPQRGQEKLFVAKFDSLCRARLYPTVWRSGAFTQTRFDDRRRQWTLTMRSEDWTRRGEDSKKDLIARLYTTFQGVLAQAGGDPEPAVLVIEDQDGNVLGKGSQPAGAEVFW
jgi:hypothetical protein